MHYTGVASTHPTSHTRFHRNIGAGMIMEFGIDIFEHARCSTRIDSVKLLVHLINDRRDIALSAISPIVCRYSDMSHLRKLFFQNDGFFGRKSDNHFNFHPLLMELFGHLDQGRNTDPATNDQDFLTLTEIGEIKAISLRSHHAEFATDWQLGKDSCPPTFDAVD
ncbi:hypothetical protein SPADD19_01129 [Streptococcus parasanguinis]|nr:hypothetical protein SPADD19_01129 [Streptococcus parasanguinis]